MFTPIVNFDGVNMVNFILDNGKLKGVLKHVHDCDSSSNLLHSWLHYLF